jgi:hypothetical protein
MVLQNCEFIMNLKWNADNFKKMICYKSEVDKLIKINIVKFYSFSQSFE